MIISYLNYFDNLNAFTAKIVNATRELSSHAFLEGRGRGARCPLVSAPRRAIGRPSRGEAARRAASHRLQVLGGEDDLRSASYSLGAKRKREGASGRALTGRGYRANFGWLTSSLPRKRTRSGAR